MVMIDHNFWKNKKVLVTGCTGFKGSWLSVWLKLLDAKLYGYSLTPPTNPSMWELLNLESFYTKMEYSDIRDYSKLKAFIQAVQPNVIIHMAAQPLVRYSYHNPRETYEVNVMGTVNLLDAIRELQLDVMVINVTTDKCYENKEWVWPYRENEPMGGHDPYSNSKGCSELVTSAFRNSFFNQADFKVKLASARAGNVIGGGDFTPDRLIPDIIKHFANSQKVAIRYPNAVRPWQHVLEPLSGYLTLAQCLFADRKYADSWNFGPKDSQSYTVSQVTQIMCDKWGDKASWYQDSNNHLYEATNLSLDCSKAQSLLKWMPVWELDATLDKLIEWYKAYYHKEHDLLELTQTQIKVYMKDQTIC